MLKIFKAFLYFPSNRPRATFGMLLLVSATNFVEGISIGFLIPLLEAIDNQTDQQSSSKVTFYLSNIFDFLNIPFELWTILVAGLLIYSLSILLKYFSETQMIKVSSIIGADIRTKIFNNLLKIDLNFLHDKKTGDLVNTITTETNRFQSVFLHSIRLISQFIACTIYLILALFLAWQLVIVAMVLMGIIFLLIRYEFQRADQLGDELSDANRNVNVNSIEHLNGIRVIKAYGWEIMSLKEFTANVYSLFQVTYNASKSRERLNGLFQLGMISALMLSIYLAITFSSINLSVLLTFVFILYRFYPKVGGINKAYHQLLFSLPGATEVLTLIDQTNTPKIVSGPERFIQLKQDICFENVNFNYVDSQPILKGIEFKIQCGKTTAIIGSSGQGKTTIVNLLMRFYDPSNGLIKVDQTDLKKLNTNDWRSVISLVNQDIFLFNDTIRNNIAIGKPTVKDSEIEEAIQIAYVEEFVNDLPDGSNTIIGERGIRLSGGQRQRIALARAIVRKPQILILDEATSELDNLSEKLIRKAVNQLGSEMTIIIVAHRLSTISDADQIILLEDGKVLESGNHHELLKLNGRYVEFLGNQD
tara:strand:- start:4702 stop:6468 length:1767 start_codon:yes stop_codon:yes gene_type:complete